MRMPFFIETYRPGHLNSRIIGGSQQPFELATHQPPLNITCFWIIHFPHPRVDFSEVSCQGIGVFASLRMEVIPFGPSRDTRSESRRVSVEAASNVLDFVM
jgi:hypothetical protein